MMPQPLGVFGGHRGTGAALLIESCPTTGADFPLATKAPARRMARIAIRLEVFMVYGYLCLNLINFGVMPMSRRYGCRFRKATKIGNL
jgi:hypothetical protein